MEFKVGDIVKCVFYGDEEFELFEEKHSSLYPVCFRRSIGDNRSIHCAFTSDGRSSPTHTHPVLTLVRRPKKKVKKTIVGYVNVYKNGMFGMIHGTEKDAVDNVIPSDKVLKVAHKIEVEVEVDE